MTKGCYTCRRRRIICDNGLPTCRKCRDAGKECLGYQKPLVWVKGGVASRGKMMGRSFDDVKGKKGNNSQTHNQSGESQDDSTALATVGPPPPANLQPRKEQPTGPVSDNPDEAQVSAPQEHTTALNVIQTPWVLVDPLFKDIGRLSRFYIDHFNQNLAGYLALYSDVRNPFRDLIPLVGDSPVIANSLAAMGALHYAILASGEFSPMPWSSETLMSSGIPSPPDDVGPTEINALTRRPSSKIYEQFLGLKQRALHQLSQDICDPVMRNDNRTLAAIMILALMDAIESGHGAWKYHLEGAKQLIQSRGYSTSGIMGWLDTFATDGCLLIQLMGSTLARPGSLTKPFYTSAMGAPVLKRLEETSWVGCPAYLLEVIFFVHAFFDLDMSSDPGSQPTMIFPSAYLPQDSNPLLCPASLAPHIQAFNPIAWAEDLQSYHYLPDLSNRIALATIYKAAVYLYATRVLSRPRPGATTISTVYGLPPDHAEVASLLIHQISLIPVSDPHFKCLIWPAFIAGAECRDASKRPFLLETLRTLYFHITSVNVRNAAWVLTLMWRKRDLRREEKSSNPLSPFRSTDWDSRPTFPTHSSSPSTATVTPLSPDDDYDYEDFDWVQELDDSRIDWLFI